MMKTSHKETMKPRWSKSEFYQIFKEQIIQYYTNALKELKRGVS